MGYNDICSPLYGLLDNSFGDIYTAEDTRSYCRGIPNLKPTVVIALLQSRRNLCL